MKPKREVEKASGAICFDIETVAQDEKRLLTLAPNFEPDSRLKDPVKIEVNIQEQKRKFVERAALNWKTAEIVLIGFLEDGLYIPIYMNVQKEEKLIKMFFVVLIDWIKSGRKIGGHNIKGFDLPMIINRARVLGIPLPDGLLSYHGGRPYWNDLIFDTMEEISFGPYNMDGNGVDDVCRAFGIQGKTGTGAEFPSLWKSDKEAAIDYNRNDIRCEVEIAKRLGYKF